jgi:uncharacterized membrane protein YeaQ/YmgE (transglycosylase-associated protein family)
MALGIVGSFLGGLVAWFFTGGDVWSPAGWIMSIVGAVVVLAIWVMLANRRRRPI